MITVIWNNERPENESQTIPNLSHYTDINLSNNNSVLFRPQKAISISHNNIWPISGNTTIDLPQSSPFGPRLKASEGYRYDFHRGIDIPADYGTPIHAIADGYVRLVSINDTYEQKDDGSIVNIYSSTVIQLKHNVSNWPDTYYSTYLHVNGTQTLVSAGSFVSKGEVIGFVGDDPTTVFAHLHFEIRYDGLYQYHNVNPWEFLPYTNSVSHEVAFIDITEVNSSFSNITVQLNASANELDVDEIEITLFDINDNLLENRSLSFNKINRNVTENYIEILDNATISKDNYLIEVFPSRFNKYNLTIHWNFTFIDVPVNSEVNTMKIRSLDVLGLESSSVSINMDTIAPTVTIDSPTASIYNTDTVSISLSGDAANYWYYIAGVDSSNQTWTTNVDRTLADGTYTLHAYGNDSANNQAHSMVVFTVDTVTPTVTIDSPTASIYNTDTITVSLSGDATNYWYYIAGVDSSNQTWTTNVDRTLADGTYTLHAYGNDTAGNELHESVILTIDTTAPIVNIIDPLSDYTYNISSVLFCFIASEDVSYIVYLDTVLIEGISNNSVITDLSDGTHNLTVIFYDTAGNNVVVEVIFTVDTTIILREFTVTTIIGGLVLGGFSLLSLVVSKFFRNRIKS